jgi:hypothetical protein
MAVVREVPVAPAVELPAPAVQQLDNVMENWNSTDWWLELTSNPGVPELKRDDEVNVTA